MHDRAVIFCIGLALRLYYVLRYMDRGAYIQVTTEGGTLNLRRLAGWSKTTYLLILHLPFEHDCVLCTHILCKEPLHHKHKRMFGRTISMKRQKSYSGNDQKNNTTTSGCI